MVRQRSFAWAMIAILIPLSASLNGCAKLKSWWGEDPVQPAVVELPSSSTECAPPEMVLSGTEEESSAAFECLAGSLGKLWTDIVGKRKDTLSESDISSLVRKGIINLPGDADKNLHRIFSIKRLLGIHGSLTKQNVADWISIIRGQRADLRALYQKLTSQDTRSGRPIIKYVDLQTAARILSAVLKQMNWAYSSEDLSQLLIAAVGIEDDDIKKALYPTANLFINVMNAVCPQFTKKDMWNSGELGRCMTEGLEFFKAGDAWVEFLINPPDTITDQDIKAVRTALEVLPQKFDQWFYQKQLTPIQTSRLIALARAIGSHPPDNLATSLDIIRRFSRKVDGRELSNGKELHPTAFIGIFDIFREVQENVLEGMPYFLDAVREHECAGEPGLDRWTDCVPTGLDEIRLKSKTIDLALRVKSIRNGQVATPFNGGFFARIMLFNTLSGKVIDAFDHDKDGVISAEMDGDAGNVVEVINVGLQAYDTIRGFISNILKKLKGLPFEESTLMKQLDGFGSRKALAKLLTLTNDLLVERTKEDRNAFEKLFDNLISSLPGTSTHLDRMALTAVITLADSLTDYRRSYLELFNGSRVPDPSGQGSLISRADFREKLPKLLEENFPRTYQSCKEFGFEASCGVAMNEILPAAEHDKTLIHEGDLDVLTIMAVAMEGLMDSCDYNKRNMMLSWKLFDGADELDCGFTRMKDVVKRLLDAKIIKTSSLGGGIIKFLLDFVDSNFITRVTGKIAMVEGSKEWLFPKILVFMFYDDATIGSIYGLMSEVIDSDATERARDLDKKKKKKKAASGVSFHYTVH